MGRAAAGVSEAMRPAPDTYAPPPDDALPVVHLDEHMIVLGKPSGLLSVPGKGEALADCLEARVQARHPNALTVHRLEEILQVVDRVIVMRRGSIAAEIPGTTATEAEIVRIAHGFAAADAA